MTTRRHVWRICTAGVALTLLNACAIDPVLPNAPEVRAAAPQTPAVMRPTSQASAELRSYLTQVQTAQLGQGLLRADGGGPDTPYTADMLARNFEQIVFYNEYAQALQGRGGESALRRWNSPVRVGVIFGDTVPKSQRDKDTDDVRNYARRLGDVTGHAIGTFGTPNFIVIFADEDDRDAALDQAADQIDGISRASLDALRDLPRETYCAVAAYAAGANPNTYTAAVAVIRAENPGILRLSCIHEEMAQGLGLANDSRDARPSIFNDDDEFALLTDHDEHLLDMLYDPRLSPGIRAAEAAPITRIIARELTAGPL